MRRESKNNRFESVFPKEVRNLVLVMFSQPSHDKVSRVRSAALAIIHQIKPKFKTRNDQIIADLYKASGAESASDPEVIIKRKAAEIAIAMAVLHGGEYQVQIDHHSHFVLVMRR